jgi:5,10-methylenetetrahydrofolate reductase
MDNINIVEKTINKLKNKSFISLEITPNKGGNLNNIISQIEQLQIDLLVDSFITTDNPLSKMKYNSILASIRLFNTFNIPCISTMSMRDRNSIALQSDLLGANDFDIRIFLTLTGDKVKHGDQPNAKSVMENNSQLLLKIIQKMNNQTDFMGNGLNPNIKPIYPFSTIHSFSNDFKHIKKRMYKKIEEHASALVTQPVYDIQHAKILIELFEDVKASFTDERKNTSLIFGLFPVTKTSTALFLHNKVPGLHHQKVL